MSDKHQQPRPPKKKPQGGQAKGFQKSGAHHKAKDQQQFTAGAHGAQPEGRRHIVHALDTEAQVQLLLAMLLLANRGTYELRAAGISHPAGRVRELRRRGFVIETHLVAAVDSDSFVHQRVAYYELVSEPTMAEVTL
ncbi:helix-turn-helix domain-containing protein [Hydrogenophaga atypica]|uniref:Helix-turn-helix domain-containing protein n=1 Tax=Hydrogenophaga atypica TaxID=249409 RepID=A0ABW2QR31_9BURK